MWEGSPELCLKSSRKYDLILAMQLNLHQKHVGIKIHIKKFERNSEIIHKYLELKIFYRKFAT